MTTLNSNNPATAVDTATEIKSFINKTDGAGGAELRVAVGLYYSATLNVIASLASNHKAGKKTQQARIRSYLLEHSPEFKALCDKANAAKKKSKNMASTQAARDTAIATVENNKRLIVATMSMFTRATKSAHYMATHMPSVEIGTGGRNITFTYPKGFNRRIGESTAKVTGTETMTRKNLEDFGIALLKEKGLWTVNGSNRATNTTSKKTEAPKVTSTVIETAKVASDALKSMSAKAREQVATSDTFRESLADSIRAAFEHDGTIAIADVVDLLTEAGMNVDTSVKVKGAKAA